MTVTFHGRCHCATITNWPSRLALMKYRYRNRMESV
jgi:hypothetical protein